MRKLGSFNKRVNLPSHPEDREIQGENFIAKDPLATLGYLYGVRRNAIPYENPLPTGAEKFQSSRQRTKRMAGDLLGVDLVQSSGLSGQQELPTLGSAEIRNA